MSHNIFDPTDNAEVFYRRDYFAAHAPEVPEWFQVDYSKLTPSRPNPGTFDNVFGRYSDHPEKFIIADFYDSEDGIWFPESDYDDEYFQSKGYTRKHVRECIAKITVEIKEWKSKLDLHYHVEQKRLLETIAQWRYAYADAMESQR